MTEDDPGFVVSLRDVYDEVKNLSGQLTAYVAAQAPVIAVIQRRIDELEREVHRLDRAHQDIHLVAQEERRHQSANRWMALASIAGSAVLAILAFVLRVPTH